jgi:hypothetical protein
LVVYTEDIQYVLVRENCSNNSNINMKEYRMHKIKLL